MAILLAPKGASEHTVDEIMGELWNNYYSSQLEVWRAIVQCTDFTKSATGRACMETLDRMFSADHDGMAAYDWMCRRYDNKRSFVKQTSLHTTMLHESLCERLGSCHSPEAAMDALNMLYSTVWLQISTNHASNPFDFVRRILTAMKALDGDIKYIGFTHTLALDSHLGSLDFADAESFAAAMGKMNKIYSDIDLFIEAIALIPQPRESSVSYTSTET